MHCHTTPRARTGILVLLLAAALSTSSCSLLPGSESTPPPPGGNGGVQPASNTSGTVEATSSVEAEGVQVIDSEQLKDLGAQEAMIVDIRDKADFELERLPDAKNVPMEEFTKKAEKWATDESIVVYGSGDARSQTAAAWLVRNGFESVYRLEGGIEAYDGKRDGPLGKYRLKKPTVIYIHHDDLPELFPDSPLTTPKVKELEKEYGKKVDFEYIDPATSKTVEQDWDGAPHIYIQNLPTFLLVDSDPRTYRKITGKDGLRVLYGWLQEHK